MDAKRPGRPDAYCAVLAGGAGRRFWPASTPERPKQFLALASSVPLIDETLARAAALVGPDRVRVIAPAALAEPMRPSLEAAGAGLIVEPRARGTGPALIWAAAELERANPGALMISMHADHRIAPVSGLRETVEAALSAARDGYLCCIGVRPNRPETGYGYVELGPAVEVARAGGASRVRVVRRFVEKPDVATAEAYVASGDYLWNTGIFIWRASDLLAAARDGATELAGAWPALERGDPESFFARAEAVSIDVCVMERAERVATVPAQFAWDDLGVWDALARGRGTDGAGNSVVGAARLVEARDNVVWTETQRANLIGVSGLVVAEANGELLVMPRAEAARLDAHLKRLDATDAPEAAGDSPPQPEP